MQRACTLNNIFLHIASKKAIKGTSGVEIKRKRNQECKDEIHHKIIVPFYEFFLIVKVINDT